MNENLAKLIGSAAAVLAIGSSAYAEQANACPKKECTFKQGYELCKDTYPAAYNAPARIEVNCSWDVFITGSFIYWKADQEGMDLATNANKVLVQKFEYKPGFKAALGMNFGYDKWVGYVEYTWLHQQTKLSSSDTTWIPTNWFNHLVDATIASKWRMNMDLLDLHMSRPFYEGQKLTVLPFGGLRAAWIRQNLRVDDGLDISHNNSHSWAVGPRAGMQAHWLLGYGFRMEGDIAGSVLFSRYTKVGHQEAFTSYNYTDYNTIRPMADMSVGLGWGSYFDKQNYHFDLLATYDFNVMWGQNMMRALVDVGNTGSSFEPADLHLQGLTVTARFDF